MAYTQDDYLKDLMIASLGDGVEKTEAQIRVRLYEAGRYEQLNTLTATQTEDSDPDYVLYERQVKQIDDRVNMALQIWLNTPNGEHELGMKRNQEYVNLRDEGERRKKQLWKAYCEKKAKEEEKRRKEAEEKAAPLKVLLFSFIMLGLIWLFSTFFQL